MSIKSKVIAAAATLTLVGGVGAVAVVPAGAATPSCGRDCLDLFSREFGTHAHPNFILDTLRQGEKVGQPQILFRVSNSDPAEDYTISYQGLVSDFFAAGLVSAAVNLHYGGGAVGFPDDFAYEIQYAPFGVDSGLCAGVGTTAAANVKVALEPCGVSSKTVWIVDSSDSTFSGYVPLINGSDTNFSHPYVLHYPGNGHPTDTPRPQLNTWNLQKYSNGTVFDNELWGANFGVLR